MSRAGVKSFDEIEFLQVFRHLAFLYTSSSWTWHKSGVESERWCGFSGVHVCVCTCSTFPYKYNILHIIFGGCRGTFSSPKTMYVFTSRERARSISTMCEKGCGLRIRVRSRPLSPASACMVMYELARGRTRMWECAPVCVYVSCDKLLKRAHTNTDTVERMDANGRTHSRTHELARTRTHSHVHTNTENQSEIRT